MPRTEQQTLKEREKYVKAFNETMVEIWKDRIMKLDVLNKRDPEHRGYLLKSVIALPMRSDGKFYDVEFEHQFTEYGLWQDYGTGAEVYRGNPGDIGRPKTRKRRKWYTIKHYASTMNLKEFMTANFGRQAISVIAQAVVHDPGHNNRYIIGDIKPE